MDIRMKIVMQIIKIRVYLKSTLYAEVFNDSLAGLDSLQKRLLDITEEECLYLKYFKAYCLKKMGFLFEAKDLLHSFSDAPYSEQLRFKI